MNHNRNSRFQIDPELEIPGGLSSDELREADQLYLSIMNRHGVTMSRHDAWKAACKAVILASEDFPELNGLESFLKFDEPNTNRGSNDDKWCKPDNSRS